MMNRTADEMRTAILNESKEVFDALTYDKTLSELQELNFRCGDGHRWCCYEMCVKGIIMSAEATDSDRDRALHLYAEYQFMEGRNAACTNIQIALQQEESEVD